MFIKYYSIRVGSITDGEGLLKTIDGGTDIDSNKVTDIDDMCGKRQFRRMDRISLLGEVLMRDLMKNTETRQIDEKRIGSVLNTSYGCLDTNIKFIGEYLSGDKSKISAIDFSHTVYNAVLGHMCKNYRIKGPSTMLLSSNYLFAAQQFMSENKAEYMIAGGVEIFVEELAEYMRQMKVPITEAGCLFLLGNEKNENDYAEIVDYCAVSLRAHPYMTKNVTNVFRDDTREKIERCLRIFADYHSLSKKGVDFVVESTPVRSDYSQELNTVREVFPNSDVVLIRERTGETFGASLGIAVLYATLRMKRDNNHVAVVNHIDINGSFISYLIKR